MKAQLEQCLPPNESFIGWNISEYKSRWELIENK